MRRGDAGDPSPGSERRDEPEDGNPLISFGEYLRRERLRRNRSLLEMARASRIPAHYLEALENDDYGKLPPRPYVKGFIDAWALHADLPPDDVWRRFERSFFESSQASNDYGRALFALFRPRGNRFSWQDWMVPMALVLIVALLWAGRSFLGREPSLSEAPGTIAQTGKPESAIPPLVLREGAVDTSGPEGLHPGGPVGVRLLLRAEANTRVSTRRDGGGVEEWTMRGGENRELTAEREVVLSLGDAGAVRLNHNGRELGFVGYKGEEKRELIFKSGNE